MIQLGAVGKWAENLIILLFIFRKIRYFEGLVKVLGIKENSCLKKRGRMAHWFTVLYHSLKDN